VEVVPLIFGEFAKGSDMLKPRVCDDRVEPTVETLECSINDSSVTFASRQIGVLDIDCMYKPTLSDESLSDRGADTACSSSDENTPVQLLAVAAREAIADAHRSDDAISFESVDFAGVKPQPVSVHLEIALAQRRRWVELRRRFRETHG